jgi:hypothetical protein
MSNDVRSLINDAWGQIQAELASIPEERMEEPGAVGEWSVKDLMAHLAVWDDVAAAKARRHLTGEPTPESEQITWQERNDREHARRKDWTLDETRQEMEAAHARMLDALSQAPDLEPEFWEDDTYGHYLEHLGDLRQWRSGL